MSGLIHDYLRRTDNSIDFSKPKELETRLKQLAELMREVRSPAAFERGARLLWREGTLPVQVGTIGRECIAGRGTGCAVRLTSPQASGRHFRIWTEGDACWLEDLGSTNGTYLNGERVTGARALCVGDAIVAGGVVLHYDRHDGTG